LGLGDRGRGCRSLVACGGRCSRASPFRGEESRLCVGELFVGEETSVSKGRQPLKIGRELSALAIFGAFRLGRLTHAYELCGDLIVETNGSASHESDKRAAVGTRSDRGRHGLAAGLEVEDASLRVSALDLQPTREPAVSRIRQSVLRLLACTGP
jgi:hypothetical protein